MIQTSSNKINIITIETGKNGQKQATSGEYTEDSNDKTTDLLFCKLF